MKLNTIGGKAVLLIVPLLVFSGLAYGIFFFELGNTDTQVLSAQFTQYRAAAEVYRKNMLEYTGLCVDLSLPDGVDCRAGTDAFRFSQPLETGDYFCTDRTGFKGRVAYLPNEIRCQ